MAIKIIYNGDSGKTLKATVERLSDGYFREDDAETFVNAPAFADKDISLTEGSSENLGSYAASLDGSAWTDGLYVCRIHDTADSNKTISSALFGVSGGYEVPIGEENALYTADINLTIDATNTQDEYTVTFFKNGTRITSGVTSPTIQVVKRSDGTDLIASTSLTEIGSTESFKYNATSTSRQTAGEAYLVLIAGTISGSSRTFSKLLGRDSSS